MPDVTAPIIYNNSSDPCKVIDGVPSSSEDLTKPNLENTSQASDQVPPPPYNEANSEASLSSVSDVNVSDQSAEPVKTRSSTMETRKRMLALKLDDLAPASAHWTTNGQGAVNLHVEEKGIAAVKPVTVMSWFATVVEKNPDYLALSEKDGNNWKRWTYGQYYDCVLLAAKGFIKLGLEPGSAVGIIGFNSPEWFFADFGTIFAGGFAAGIYTTNSPEACHYVADNCNANIIVVENDIQLKKILQVKEQLPHLKAVVQYKGEVKPESKLPYVYTWAEMMQMAAEVSDDILEERIRSQAPNKCCTLIYTSGTTGNPKGVMLSHDNLCFTAKSTTEFLKLSREHAISYLPLSHVAAQMMDMYAAIESVSSIYFAKPDALKGSLLETLKEVRPTGFFGVPRVWEKIQEKMKAAAKNTTGMKRKMAVWAKGVGLKGNLALMNGGQVPFGWGIANALVFKKVRRALGLDRCRTCYSGAAPISRDTLEFFLSLNIPIYELYGMSETSAPHSLSFVGGARLGSCGRDLTGVKTVFTDVDAEGNGEICMKGRHVFMGYLNMEEKTREALDDDGLLHSGDVGRKDKDGFLYITGRIKELIITAGGENVAPVLIEDTVKEELPIISNCMLVGDRKKFLSILLTLKTEVDENASPLNELSPLATNWCRSIGSQATKVSDIVSDKDEVVLKAIQEGIDRANKKSVSNAQKVQKWSILPRDFSLPGGELGPTLKLKRPVVHKMYADTIESFYSNC